LKNPEVVFSIVENLKNEECYFGREVASSYKNERDIFYRKFDNNLRPYLGPTTLGVELAFLMANMGNVAEGDIVYDPFCGTGSILNACSYFKALCTGSDIDVRVIKGLAVGRKTKNKVPGLENIKKYDFFTNFKHYGQPLPDALIVDNS